MKTSASRRALLGAALGVALAPARAQPSPAEIASYPNRPIRIVVPYSPGAINDNLARAVGERLQAALGQPVVVENRPGAGAVIGTQFVASAPPDGYTLLQVPAAHVINATLAHRLPYDSVASFSFITLAATSPFVLIGSNAFAARSVPELVALAKKSPGAYSYASSGNGGNAHLMAEMLKHMAGIDVVHVPYKGIAPAINDLIGGQVQFLFSTYPGAAAAIQARRVRVLGVTSRERWQAFPELPTIAEAGYPDYDVQGWWGYAAPAGTPAAIVATLNREINKALASPALKSGLTAEGVEVRGSTPEQFRSHVEAQIRAWAALIKQAGVKLD
jgi:tripartite-type tricarboxylate transporter receptor subunit TctC